MEETPVRQAFLPNVGQTLARRFFAQGAGAIFLVDMGVMAMHPATMAAPAIMAVAMAPDTMVVAMALA